MRTPPRRCQSKQYTRKYRNAGSEREDSDIGPKVQIYIQKNNQQSGGPSPQRHAHRSTGPRQQQTFGEKLPNQPRASRAERYADCDFTFARGRACQKQIRDVGAGNQEDDSDNSQQDH